MEPLPPGPQLQPQERSNAQRQDSLRERSASIEPTDSSVSEEQAPPAGFDLNAELDAATAPVDRELPSPDGELSDVAGPPDYSQGEGPAVDTEAGPMSLAPPPAGGPGGGPGGGPPGSQSMDQAPQTTVAPLQTRGPETCSGDLQSAWQGYLSAATGVRQGVVARGEALKVRVGGAADQALGRVSGAAQGLRDHINSKVLGANETAAGLYQAARDQAQTVLDGRLGELRIANEQACKAVLDRSLQNQETVQGRVTTLAAEARAMGNERAELLLSHAAAQVQAINTHSQGLTGQYYPGGTTVCNQAA